MRTEAHLYSTSTLEKAIAIEQTLVGIAEQLSSVGERTSRTDLLSTLFVVRLLAKVAVQESEELLKLTKRSHD